MSENKQERESITDFWEGYKNLYSFEEGSPEYLIDREDFHRFIQRHFEVEELGRRFYTREW